MAKAATALASVATSLPPVASNESDESTPVSVSTVTPKKRGNLEIIGVSSDVPMPSEAAARKRGSQSMYDFASLEVGQSIAIRGRKADNLLSTLNNAHRLFQVDMLDANGNIVYKTKTVKQSDGTPKTIVTNEPKKVKTREFFANDCDPNTDPQGADCRIWRKR